jgi:hypothetical protein
MRPGLLVQRERGLALEWPLADHSERLIGRGSHRTCELSASRQFVDLPTRPSPGDQ